MNINRSFGIILVLICIALWCNLLRPLIGVTPAKAQTLSPSSSTATQPIIIEPKEGTPYMVIANGNISVWYLNVPETTLPKQGESDDDVIRKMEQNTKLICVDSHPLSSH